MKIIARDTRVNYQKVTVEFGYEDLRQIGVSLYSSSSDSDDAIIAALSSCLKNNSVATNIAVRDFTPCRIVKEAIERLEKWMTEASIVAANGDAGGPQ